MRGGGIRKEVKVVSFRSVENKLDRWADMLNPALDVATSFMRVAGRTAVILFAIGIFFFLLLLLGNISYYAVSALLGIFF